MSCRARWVRPAIRRTDSGEAAAGASPLEAQEGSGASKTLLRKYSKRRPWKRFVPEGELTSNCAPPVAAFLGGCHQRIDAELLDRVQRNGEPHPLALCLIHDVGGIDAVVGEVAVVEAASGKANRPLVAAAGVNGAGNKGRQ